MWKTIFISKTKTGRMKERKKDRKIEGSKNGKKNTFEIRINKQHED